MYAGWYSPGRQRAHVARPASSANVPGVQTPGSVAPVLQAAPSGQTEQSSGDERPRVRG